VNSPSSWNAIVVGRVLSPVVTCRSRQPGPGGAQQAVLAFEPPSDSAETASNGLPRCISCVYMCMWLMLSIVYWNNTAWHCPVTVPGCILLAGATETIHSQDAQSYIVFHWWLRGRDLEGEKYQQSQHSLTPQLKTFSVWLALHYFLEDSVSKRAIQHLRSISIHQRPQQRQEPSTVVDQQRCDGPSLLVVLWAMSWTSSSHDQLQHHSKLIAPSFAGPNHCRKPAIPFIRFDSTRQAWQFCPAIARTALKLPPTANSWSLWPDKLKTSRYGGSTKILSNIEQWHFEPYINILKHPPTIIF